MILDSAGAPRSVVVSGKFWPTKVATNEADLLGRVFHTDKYTGVRSEISSVWQASGVANGPRDWQFLRHTRFLEQFQAGFVRQALVGVRLPARPHEFFPCVQVAARVGQNAVEIAFVRREQPAGGLAKLVAITQSVCSGVRMLLTCLLRLSARMSVIIFGRTDSRPSPFSIKSGTPRN
jgi:hypothetical protein